MGNRNDKKNRRSARRDALRRVPLRTQRRGPRRSVALHSLGATRKWSLGVCCSWLAVLVVLALVAPALRAADQTAATPQGEAYEPDAGPHKVLTVGELILHDDKRGKDLPLKIYYPDAAGPFPVIVWSHGAGGSKDGYASLGQHWASHGYVTIHPSHDDSLAVRWKKGERVTLADTARSALTEPDRWVNRPKDISFVLDSLAAIEERAPALKGKMDTARIGVGGHSFGAYTTQVIGGATVDIPGQGKGLSFRDKRVRAVLMYSPQGIGQMGLTADSWKDFTLPAMMVTGTNDLSALGQGPKWRRAGFDSAPAGDKYWVLIQGAPFHVQ